MAESRRVRFDLFAPETFLRAHGCDHDTEEEAIANAPTCRACAVSLEAHRLKGEGRLELVLEPMVHPEFDVPGLAIRGSYADADDRARLCVTRTIAYLHGHREPLELAAELEAARA